jgi:DNA modification methylase
VETLTLLKMAKEHGRRYIGIEVNPEYVAICMGRPIYRNARRIPGGH